PQETGIYASKPELIGYDGICHCLDCWRVEIAKCNQEYTSLKAYASSKSMFEEL
ncbi:hypothetical protein SCLCIDRAFT_124194, partial [Scleroderma citrinum Foug A]